MRHLLLVCLTLTLVSGCVSRVGGAPRAGETPPTTGTTPTWEPPPKVGRYAAGDCVVSSDQTPLPCDQPHHSEAVEPVIVLGKVSDPAPSQDEIIAKTNDPCRAAVREYLGGEERDGINWGMTYGASEQWKQGFTTATCFAVSEQPVTGSLAG